MSIIQITEGDSPLLNSTDIPVAAEDDRHGVDGVDGDHVGRTEHMGDSSLSKLPAHLINTFNNIQKLTTSTLTQVYANMPSSQLINAYIQNLSASTPIQLVEKKELTDAIENLNNLNEKYTSLIDVVEGQLGLYKALYANETQLSMILNQWSIQENIGNPELSTTLASLSGNYSDSHWKLKNQISALGAFRNELKTFKNLAIQDTLTYLEKQKMATLKLDACATKYHNLLLKLRLKSDILDLDFSIEENNYALKEQQREDGTQTNGVNVMSEKEFEAMVIADSGEEEERKFFQGIKEEFIVAKARYLDICDGLQEKVRFLMIKKDVDLNEQVKRVLSSY